MEEEEDRLRKKLPVDHDGSGWLFGGDLCWHLYRMWLGPAMGFVSGLVYAAVIGAALFLTNRRATVRLEIRKDPPAEVQSNEQ